VKISPDLQTMGVISGKVDAGAVDIGTYMEMPPESRDRIISLGETELLVM
jgi:hypothetical protein